MYVGEAVWPCKKDSESRTRMAHSNYGQQARQIPPHTGREARDQKQGAHSIPWARPHINSVNTCKYIVYACLVLVCTLSVHAHTVYIGLHNLKPHWLCIYIACTLVIHVYTLYVHVMYMFYDLHTVHQHRIYCFLPFCPMLVDRNLQFCTLTV